MQLNLDNFKAPQKGHNSYWVTFEGIDGCGKSTQVKELVKYLEGQGFTTDVFREPGGTLNAEKIRELILNKEYSFCEQTRTYLLLASRVELLHSKVLPRLKKDNHIVILDRFMLSTLAYQGHGLGLGIGKLLAMHDNEYLRFMPDLQIYLDLAPGVSAARKKGRSLEQNSDHFETKPLAFSQLVYEGFNKLCNVEGFNITRIDASLSLTAVTSKIQEVIKRKLIC